MVFLFAGLVSVPALAAEPAWDQAKVTHLAAELAKSCDQLYTTYWKLGGQGQVGTGDASDVYALNMKLQTIQTMTRSLAGALVSGQGRARTKPMVEDIGEVAWDARLLLEHMFVETPLMKQIDAARAIWLQLIPYYGIKPPPAPPKP